MAESASVSEPTNNISNNEDLRECSSTDIMLNEIVNENNVDNVEVTFILLPDHFTHVKLFTYDKDMASVKSALADDLQIPTQSMLFALPSTEEEGEDRIVMDSDLLNDVIEDKGKLIIHVTVRNSPSVTSGGSPNQGSPRPQLLEITSAEYVMPENFDVIINGRNGEETRVITVYVTNEGKKKPYLGGYRHRKTGIEYHHSSTQTTKKEKRLKHLKEHFHRESQTVKTVRKQVQTVVTEATQMTKPGVFVADEGDYTREPGRYMTADEWHAVVLRACIRIQSWMRGSLTRKRVRILRSNRDKRRIFEVEDQRRKLAAKDAEVAKALERRKNPRSKADFDVLYHGLETWCQREHEKIEAADITAKDRTVMFTDLLNEECRLLASIDRLKVTAAGYNKERSINAMLNSMCAPKRWVGFDGKMTSVHTPQTVRAQELRDLYMSVTQPLLTLDERLDVLIHLKWTVKEFETKLTRELVDLIDREANLLMRGVKESSLDGLRRRIANSFLEFIETPEFNPESIRFSKIPQNKAENVYHSYVAYVKDTGQKLRADHAHYFTHKLLATLQREEYARDDDSYIIYLMQIEDLTYLVVKIWNRQSALSGSDEVDDLTLTRWNPKEELSPWNCILLTEKEAAEHNVITNLEEGHSYAPNFVKRVEHRHLVARQHFSTLYSLTMDHRRSLERAQQAKAEERMRLREEETARIRQEVDAEIAREAAAKELQQTVEKLAIGSEHTDNASPTDRATSVTSIAV